MTDFKPYVGRKRKSGTGCVSQINDHLFEGRYSPKWPDGKKHARNVYSPYPRGVRGETESAHREDESRAGGVETAESGRNSAAGVEEG